MGPRSQYKVTALRALVLEKRDITQHIDRAVNGAARCRLEAAQYDADAEFWRAQLAPFEEAIALVRSAQPDPEGERELGEYPVEPKPEESARESP